MSYRYESLYIMHYGVGHDKGGHSGRYPWGSGEEPYQDLSAAERRKKFLDKHWYHKGAKTRLGVDHIRDVDPNTKLSDLFKYNKRTTSDVLADKVLTFIYGDTEMSREELRKKKYNLMSAITAAEAVAATAVLVGGLNSIKAGLNFATANLDKKVDDYKRYSNILTDASIKSKEHRINARRNNAGKIHDNIREQYHQKGVDEMFKVDLMSRINQRGIAERSKKNSEVIKNMTKSGADTSTGKITNTFVGNVNTVMNGGTVKNNMVSSGKSFIDKFNQDYNRSKRQENTKRALEEFMFSNLNDPRLVKQTQDRLARDSNKLF